MTEQNKSLSTLAFDLYSTAMETERKQLKRNRDINDFFQDFHEKSKRIKESVQNDLHGSGEQADPAFLVDWW